MPGHATGPAWASQRQPRLPDRSGTDRRQLALITRRARPSEWCASIGGMPCDIGDGRDLARQLDGAGLVELQHYTKLEVEGRTFGYLWEPTCTIGLRQTIAEQEALVAERPDVFEVQFTAYGYGWVVCHLEGIERDELAELILEAWRLSAPARVLEARGDKRPV